MKFNLYNFSNTVFLNPDGSILSWGKSQALEKGYEAADTIGKKFYLLLADHAERPQFYSALLKRAAEKGKARASCMQVRKDGTRSAVDIVLSSILDENKKVLGFTLSFESPSKLRNLLRRINVFGDDAPAAQ